MILQELKQIFYLKNVLCIQSMVLNNLYSNNWHSYRMLTVYFYVIISWTKEVMRVLLRFSRFCITLEFLAFTRMKLTYVSFLFSFCFVISNNTK